jgi:hypothetical protein
MTKLYNFPISTLPPLAVAPRDKYEDPESGLKIDNNGAPANTYANAARNEYCINVVTDIGNEEEECIAHLDTPNNG